MSLEARPVYSQALSTWASILDLIDFTWLEQLLSTVVEVTRSSKYFEKLCVEGAEIT